MKSTEIKDKKILARVYFCATLSPAKKSQEEIIQSITRDISDSSTGYAGFSKKQYLRDFLSYQIFDHGDDLIKIEKLGFEKEQIEENIKTALQDVAAVLPIEKTLRIYIFPSFSKFVKEKMGGVSGYTPWENTILLFIDPLKKNWKDEVKKTIVHEYAHAVSRQFHRWETLRDSIVFEGIAENLVQEVYRGEMSPWASALSLRQAKKYFNKVEKNFSSKEMLINQDVFFGSKAFPLWTGYAIGYYLVKAYREKDKNFSWIDMLQKKPIQIVQNSSFGDLR